MSLLLAHQIEAASKMFNGCILKGATGTGKTITALSYYSDCENPGRLIVITTAKKRDAGDWEAEGRLLAIFPEVDSWQNLHKYKDVEGAFFIFDEQRVVGSGPWVQAFGKITKKNDWVLLSATPGDTWLDYIPVFVANGFYVNRTDFVEQHVVFDRWAKYPKVKKILGEQKLQRLLNSILIEMPFEKSTIRHEVDVFCDYDREQYDMAWKRRWNWIEDAPIRNVSELCSMLRRACYADPSRLEKIRDLLVEHPKMIIFYNFDYELYLLRTLPVKIAEWNGHKHEQLPDGDEWVYLVQYMAGAEGWNCFSTDTIVFYSMTYSYRMFEQAKGRTDRIGTPFTDLWYFMLRSGSPIDVGVFKSVTDKKDFNERRWVREAA
jgi:hypothetical protein